MRISDWSSDVCSSDLKNSLIAPVTTRVSHIASVPTTIASCQPITIQRSEGARGGIDTAVEAVRPSSDFDIDLEFPPKDVEIIEEFRLAARLLRRVALREGQAELGLDASSEERRGGKEGVSTVRSRWSPYH